MRYTVNKTLFQLNVPAVTESNQLILRSTAVFEKLIIAQLVNKFHSFY
jgi:hypothetical protein